MTDWNGLSVRALTGDATTDSQYLDTVRAILIAEETLTRTTPDAQIYGDSKGIPTIGIGLNVRANFMTIMDYFDIEKDNSDLTAAEQKIENGYRSQINSLINDSWGSPFTVSGKALNATLNAKIDAILVARAKQSYVATLYGALAPPLSLTLSVNDADTLFNSLAPSYQSSVDDFTSEASTTDVAMPSSLEAAALFSLDWNAPTLLSKGLKLKNDLKDSNRAEAWYQIRYRSNKSNSVGLAKRRDFESTVFGLYDPGSVTDAEAKQIFAMTTAHQAVLFPSEKTLADKEVSAASTDYQSAISYISQNDSVVLTINTLTNELAPAQQYLIDTYAPGSSILPQNIIVVSSSYEKSNNGNLNLETHNGDMLIFIQNLHHTLSLTTNDGNDVIYAGSTSARENIDLGSGADTIDVDDPSNFTGTISGFGFGDMIDLSGIGLATSATLGANNALNIKESDNSVLTLQLDPTLDYSKDIFTVSSDGDDGTDVSASSGFSDNFNEYKFQTDWVPPAKWNVLGGPDLSVDIVDSSIIANGKEAQYAKYGKFVDLDGTTSGPGTLQTDEYFAAGNYTLSFDLSGNARLFPPETTAVTLGNFTQSITLSSDDFFTLYTYDITTTGGHLQFHDTTGGNQRGNLLDNVKLVARTS